ncbi:hypothetical protein Tco_1479466, partial [Tanacetum coccineum]
MLDLRDKVRYHSIYQVGNGKSISAWYDKWCSLGPLSSFIPKKAIFDARMSIKIPMLNDRLDGVKWLDKNNQVCKFSTKNVWLTLRDDWPKVDWKHIVWFSQFYASPGPDSHDHLFFNCPYASNIWHMISSKGNMLSGMQSLSIVVRLMETRPKRSNIWQNCKRTVEEIVMIITRNIEEMLMSLRVKKSKAVDKAAE